MSNVLCLTQISIKNMDLGQKSPVFMMELLLKLCVWVTWLCFQLYNFS